MKFPIASLKGPGPFISSISTQHSPYTEFVTVDIRIENLTEEQAAILNKKFTEQFELEYPDYPEEEGNKNLIEDKK